MKVIKNNITKEEYFEEQILKFPMKVICEHCGSEFELEENDVEIGQFGLYYFTCPCCGDTSYIDNGIELTSENLDFPKHYYDFSDGKNIPNEEINRYVKECINSLRNSTDENFYHTCTGSGDTIVHVTRYDEDENFVIDVCKNYYEVEIPYTEKDKEKWCN